MKDKDRNYKLSVIWRSQDSNSKFIFTDGSEQYFMPRLKLEKIDEDKYELLSTTSNLYLPLEDYLVDYAYETSLESLANSLSYTTCYNKLVQIETSGGDITEKNYSDLKEKIKKLESKKAIHLNQIKENYGTIRKTIKNPAGV